MAYEKVQGDQLFDGQIFHGNNQVLIRDTETGIARILPLDEAGEDVRYIPGLIRPGFVNAHCHLELSHMKTVIPRHTGLVPFLQSVVKQRNFPEQEIAEAIEHSLREMEDDSIVAVGDISNTSITVPYKRKSNIRFRNFIEVLSFSEANTEPRLAHYRQVLQQFLDDDLDHSQLTPHAPYSVSASAFNQINLATENQFVSIHNQESKAENELFQSGGGAFLQLFSQLGMHQSPFTTTGLSSLRSFLPYFDRGQTILLVHNTFTSVEDVTWAQELAKQRGITLYFCLCVNANLYIENTVPDISMLRRSGANIVLGTDSYSSNDQLKISSEISTIAQWFPDIPREELYRWATINGNAALGIPVQWLCGLPFVEGVQHSQ